MAALDVVCDAGPLIHLDELSCLDLLHDFGQVWVPDVVLEEVEQHRPGLEGRLPSPPFRRTRVASRRDSRLQTLTRTLGLHRGEIAALNLIGDLPAAILLTDDAAARMAAKSLGLRAYGTLGVLVRSIRQETRTRHEVVSLLRDLPQLSTLHIRSALLAEIIAEVEAAR